MTALSDSDMALYNNMQGKYFFDRWIQDQMTDVNRWIQDSLSQNDNENSLQDYETDKWLKGYKAALLRVKNIYENWDFNII